MQFLKKSAGSVKIALKQGLRYYATGIQAAILLQETVDKFSGLGGVIIVHLLC